MASMTPSCGLIAQSFVSDQIFRMGIQVPIAVTIKITFTKQYCVVWSMVTDVSEERIASILRI